MVITISVSRSLRAELIKSDEMNCEETSPLMCAHRPLFGPRMMSGAVPSLRADAADTPSSPSAASRGFMGRC